MGFRAPYGPTHDGTYEDCHDTTTSINNANDWSQDPCYINDPDEAVLIKPPSFR